MHKSQLVCPPPPHYHMLPKLQSRVGSRNFCEGGGGQNGGVHNINALVMGN